MKESEMRTHYIVDVFAQSPDNHQLVEPIHEHLVKVSDPQDAEHIGLWEALLFYVRGDAEPLINLLKRDSKACNLLVKFEEHWFVRAEMARDSKGQSHTKTASQAVVIARSARNKKVCRDVLKEIGFDVQSRGDQS